MSKPNLKSAMKTGLAGGLKAPAPVKRDNPFESTVTSESTVPVGASTQVKSYPAPVAAAKPQDERKPKAQIFTERVTLVISAEQRDMVEELARKIQRNGTKKQERVTANTVMRCLINLLEGFDADLTAISDETELNQAMQDFFKK
jgi:hypothetical protein